MTSTPPEQLKNETTTQMPARGQDVEYALVLSRIIDQVKSDPAQLRWAIYEVARARLKIDSAALERSERDRLTEALETAIDGVEAFSVKSDHVTFLPPPPAEMRSGRIDVGVLAPSRVVSSAHRDASESFIVDGAADHIVRPVQDGRRGFRPPLWLVILVPLLAATAVVALVKGGVVQPARYFGVASNREPIRQEPTPPPAATTPADPQPAAASSAPTPPPVPAIPGFPLPTVFGIYALHDGALIELDAIAETVPDKRVSMSTPITKPSRTTLPDGKVGFVIYRRDTAENSPDRFDVRVVARVERAVTFGPNGRPAFTPVENTWSIRQFTYEFRVRPVPNGPGMLLVQPEKADFSLPAGRYVLVMRDRGYDFTVAGKVTDPAHCLERTEASNGTFYSDCTKR